MPILSILIPTYNRPKILENLLSYIYKIYDSSSVDFIIEIIICNDYLEKIEIKNFNNEKINLRIINNEENLGEAGNLNKLLSLACGEYIVWLFDDDSIDSLFFNYFQDILLKKINFDVFLFGNSCGNFDSMYKIESNIKKYNYELINRNYFIKKFLYKNYIGFIAIYKRLKIIEAGGVIKLTNQPIAASSEFYLIFQVLKFENIIISNDRLIRVCLHSGSYSSTVVRYEPYYVSGINLYKNIFSDRLVDVNDRRIINYSRELIFKNFLIRLFLSQNPNKYFYTIKEFYHEVDEIFNYYKFDLFFIFFKCLIYSSFVAIYKYIVPLSIRFNVAKIIR